MAGDALRQVGHGGFGYAAASHHASPDVHQSVEEGPCRQHHGLGPDFSTPDGLDAHDVLGYVSPLVRLSGKPRHHFGIRARRPFLHQQFLHLVLPNVKVGGSVQHGAPLPDKLATVTLCSRTPHGGTLRAVQHPKLDGGGIGHLCHLSAQGVNLAYYLAFGYAANGWVARHLANLVHIHRHQQRLGTHVSCRCGSLASGVTASYHHYIVFHYHAAKVVQTERNSKFI